MVRRPEFTFEVTVVDGERGRLLAAEQAVSILTVLEWFGRPTACRVDADLARTETNANDEI